jgi:ribonucleoside-diphosphate reductase alpha chain
MDNKFGYEESLEASISYFNGDELAAKVFLDKYALKNEQSEILEKSPYMMHSRLAKEFARIEKNKFKVALTEAEIFSFFDRFKYIVPQGSPMFGIGNNFQIISLSNCYVVETPSDSIGGILKTDQQLAQISKRRGGNGASLNSLRPSGAPTKNSSRSSTGVPSFAERYSNTIREIGQSGRRGALMLTLSVHHPDCCKIDDAQWESPKKIVLKGDAEKQERDIVTDSRFYDENNVDFCSMKLNRKKVTGANISIQLSDEFLNAVKKGTKYEQRFPLDYKEKGVKPMVSKMVDARKVWQKIIHCAWQSAEPGLLFWDLIRQFNAVDCYAKHGFATESTNPCSELPLCILDSCRLMVQNLYSYVLHPFSKDARFDYDLFYAHAKISQRLMDDLIDLELEKIYQIIAKIKSDPEPEEIKREELTLWEKIAEKCSSGRRTGLGVTGEGDAIAAVGLKYGSDESIKFVEKIHKTQKLASFDSSCEMAQEIGAFPVWDWELEKDSAFLLQIKKEDEALYERIKKYGRRNIANLTIAPAGTVSIMTQTTSGVEPLFDIKPYERRKKINPNDSSSRVDFTDTNGDKWQKFEVKHPKLQIWMDVTGEKDWKKSPWYGSCAPDIDWKQRVKLQAAAQRHIDHAISSTINLPAEVTEEKVAEIYLEAWESGCKGITVYREGCRSGVLIRKDKEEGPKITKTVAPKRPKSLEGKLHFFNFRGDKYFVAVGLLGGTPYEIFTGFNSEKKRDFIPKDCNTGQIKKHRRGHYVFESATDGETYALNNGHSDDNADALTRMISCSLRHGSDIAFVIHQLEKTSGDLSSFSKCLARTLKCYVENGKEVSGEECSECGSKLHRENGCIICKNCGNSKCG